MTRCMAERGLRFDDYEALWRWSIEDARGVLGGDLGASSTCAPLAVRRACSPTASMPGAVWFPGAELNYAEHAVPRQADDALAIIAASEGRDRAR